MRSSSRGRVRSIAALTTVASVSVAAVAFGHVPGVGNGNQLTTDPPDLRSVKISDASANRVQYCFDAPVQGVGTVGQLFLQTYDANRYMSPSSAPVSGTDPNCVTAQFPAALDIAQATIGTAGPGAVKDSGGRDSVPASEPLQGSAATAVAGATTGPDLTGATANFDTAPGYVDFAFDESIDPALQPGADAPNKLTPGDFHFINDAGEVIDGSAASRVGESTIRVTFPVNTSQANRVFVTAGAVRDRPQTGTYPAGGALTTPNGTDAAPIKAATGLPVLQSISGGPQEITLTYNREVNKGTAAAIVAVVDDGRVFPGQTVVEQGTSSLRVTFADAIGNDVDSVVRVVDRGGAAVSRGDTTPQPSAPTRVNVSTANSVPGFTNGPDLLSVSYDAGANQATYRFDEGVVSASSGSFFAVAPSGTLSAGSGTSQESGTTVKVNLPSTASTSLGAGNVVGAAVDSLGHRSPIGSVSYDVQQAPPVVTPPVTTPPVVTPPPTKASTKVTLSRKGSTRKRSFSGRVSSAGKGCKSGRLIILRRSGSTKRITTTHSRGDGTYRFKTRRRPASKVRVYVTQRTSTKYNVTCRGVTSRTIRG